MVFVAITAIKVLFFLREELHLFGFCGMCYILPMSNYTIIHAQTKPDLAAIRALFMEYQDFLDIDLDFQDFGAELAKLPGKYAPPTGRLFLARCEGKPAGCVAFYRMEEGVCELKRLYVSPPFVGKGIGKALFDRALEEAKAAGYTTMRLDSLRRLKDAGKLYEQYGFREIAPFNKNPHHDVYYMEKAL